MGTGCFAAVQVYIGICHRCYFVHVSVELYYGSVGLGLPPENGTCDLCGSRIRAHQGLCCADDGHSVAIVLLGCPHRDVRCREVIVRHNASACTWVWRLVMDGWQFIEEVFVFLLRSVTIVAFVVVWQSPKR
jgi:hypothetical protein